MTTGQPIKFPSDRNKYNNEYMESLQLQIDLNQKNLEVNRLYKETGQLPASTQMMDTRSNEEKLMDVEYLKKQIISDLKPIAEPMFASAVIQGVINSPLNVNNSLFRYLAQNAQTFAQTLFKKYKFGIAGDANDVAIMVQFLEDAYNKTKNTFQSIKGYINSNTNEGNKTRSNILSANDTDNLIIELKDLLKRISNVEGLPASALNDLMEMNTILIEIVEFLPSSEQMRVIIDKIVEVQNAFGNPLAPINLDYAEYLPGGIADSVFKILQLIPKLSSVQTLIDRLDRALRERDTRVVREVCRNMINLFAQFNTAENRALLVQFRNEYINRANIELQRQNRQSAINFADQMRIQNAVEASEKKAQRVYIINPPNDAVNVRGQMNMGDGGGGGGSSISGLTDYTGFNTIKTGSTDYGDYSLGSATDSGWGDLWSNRGSSDSGFGPPRSAASSTYSQFLEHDPIPDAINHYNFMADQNALQYYNDPDGYARVITRLNALYSDLNGLNVLRDPANHPMNPANHPMNPANRPPSNIPVQQAPPSNIPVQQAPPGGGAKQSAPRYPERSQDDIRANNNYYYDLIQAVKNAKDSGDAQQVHQLENDFFNELGRTIQGINDALQSNRAEALTPKESQTLQNRLLELENDYEVYRQNPHNKDGIIGDVGTKLRVFKNLPGYNQLVGFKSFGTGLKKVKKGRGLYSPFGDSEINHKNLENNILTLRRKSKTNYMDLPSKHISKHMKNIIHNIVGGKIANFEDIHNLNDEERNYLNKVISKSNLQDRLSVPAPSKDQADKDNHQWEVMRGEIMAGNDSHELVKKFKILTMKLTRQGLLPKNEVMELFEDLVNLGY